MSRITSAFPRRVFETAVLNINPSGVIAGQMADAINVAHGLVRAEDGTITTFDALGAGIVPGQGAAPFSGATNPAGATTGSLH